MKDWEAESAAAAVPFPDDEKLTRRTAIWDRLERIRLHDVEVARSSVPATRPPSGPIPKRATEPARRAAIRGTLAMAALGGTLVRRPRLQGSEQGDYRKTLERSRLAGASRRCRVPGGTKRRGQGDRIGLRFRALRGKVDALPDEGRGIADFAAFHRGFPRPTAWPGWSTAARSRRPPRPSSPRRDTDGAMPMTFWSGWPTAPGSTIGTARNRHRTAVLPGDRRAVVRRRPETVPGAPRGRSEAPRAVSNAPGQPGPQKARGPPGRDQRARGRRRVPRRRRDRCRRWSLSPGIPVIRPLVSGSLTAR